VSKPQGDVVIGIICPADFVKRQPFGGASGLIENIMVNLGFPCTVFGIGINGTEPWQPKELFPNVTFLPVADFTYPARVPLRISTLIAYFRARQSILRSGVGLLYIHSPEVALPFLFGNRDIPVVFHQHGSGNPITRAKFLWARIRFFEKIFDLMLHLIHRRSDWTIAIDNECYAQAAKSGIAHKTTLLMNAVDMNKFRPDAGMRNAMRRKYGISDDECAILFVGRIEEIKRVDRVVEAMVNLRAEEKVFRLFLAGDGTCRKKLDEFVLREGLGDRITFFGDVAHDELPSYYNMSDLLVLPSEMEGVPMVILESLACGTPVIATNVGGIPDIVKDGENGFVLDEPEPARLAEAICRASRLEAGRAEIAGSVSHLSTACFVVELKSIIKKAQSNKLARCGL
jgi:glycosyltransferase involved in cell wall biosynthesis